MTEERCCIECGTDISHRRQDARTCSDLCRKRHALGGICALCGARTSYNANGPSKLCRRCSFLVPNPGAMKQRDRAEPKYRRIEHLWGLGMSRRAIAQDVGTTEQALGVVMAKLRKRGGYNLPHRHQGYD